MNKTENTINFYLGHQHNLSVMLVTDGKLWNDVILYPFISDGPVCSLPKELIKEVLTHFS